MNRRVFLSGFPSRKCGGSYRTKLFCWDAAQSSEKLWLYWIHSLTVYITHESSSSSSGSLDSLITSAVSWALPIALSSNESTTSSDSLYSPLFPSANRFMHGALSTKIPIVCSLFILFLREKVMVALISYWLVVLFLSILNIVWGFVILAF